MKILFLVGNPPIAALSEWEEIKQYKELGYFVPTKEIYSLTKALEQNIEFEKIIGVARKNIGLSEGGVDWETYVAQYMPREKRKLTKEGIDLFTKAALQIIEIRKKIKLDYFVDKQLPYLIYGNFVYFVPPLIWYYTHPTDVEGEEDNTEYHYSVVIKINNRITKNELINYIEHDWKNISREINSLQPKLEFYISPRDKRIISLKEENGLRFNVIADMIIEEFNIDDFDGKINEDSVKTAYARAKKKILALTQDSKDNK